MESKTLSAGNELTLFEAEGHRFGLCICFDIRFAELSMAMALKGTQAIIVPAAFNMTTGPMHWELTFHTRAVDNQLYTLGAASARDTDADLRFIRQLNRLFTVGQRYSQSRSK